MPIRAEQKVLYPADWKQISLRVRERSGWTCEFCQEARQGEPHPITRSKVVLTVAHLDHDPTNRDEDDMAAMCQRCHLTYDAPLHAANAARTRRAKAPQRDIFEGTAHG